MLQFGESRPSEFADGLELLTMWEEQQAAQKEREAAARATGELDGEEEGESAEEAEGGGWDSSDDEGDRADLYRTKSGAWVTENDDDGDGWIDVEQDGDMDGGCATAPHFVVPPCSCKATDAERCDAAWS